MMKVVIIDDNEMNVALLKNLVARALHEEPVCFLVSAEALEWCRTNEADLILVDYMMPSPDGLEWIQLFRQIEGRAETPVVMITAVNEKDIRYKALQSGANDFLNKPVDTTEFLARAKNMLVLRKWQKELSNRAEWLAAEVRKATADILAREREVIFHLTKAAEYRSPETGSHIVRVALYSREIAKHLGLSETEQDLIFNASPMHDIGKVGTPDLVLHKGDKLDEDEFAIMKEHTVMGYEILQSSESKLLQFAAQIALTHHEKYNGTGYPRGLKGDEIPLVSRICTLSDIFDALTTERIYKPAWTVDQALTEIDNLNGTTLDPKIVDAFKKALPDILTIRKDYADNRN
jgi:putative two-component system response regulator